MTNTQLIARQIPLSVAVCLLALTSHAPAFEVQISFVTIQDDNKIALEPFHELRRSPFGGWVASFWPFGMRVNTTPILEFEEKLLQNAASEITDQIGSTPIKTSEWELADDLLGLAEGPAVLPGIQRPASVKLNLNAGDYKILPGDLRFSIKGMELVSEDPRLAIDREAQTIEVVLWPVTVRCSDGSSSLPFTSFLFYEGIDLVKGVLKPLEDPEERKVNRKTDEPVGEPQFRRIQIFLPPSPKNSTPYHLNGVPFTVTSEGSVRMAKNERVSLRGETELQLAVRPKGPPEVTRFIGLRWLHTGNDYTATLGKKIVAISQDAGSSLLELAVSPAAESVGFKLGPKKNPGNWGVSFANNFDRWPYKTVIVDAAPRAAQAYLFETADYEVQPGGEYVCRLSVLAGKDAGIKAVEMPSALAEEGRQGRKVDLTLKAREDGVFAGQIPADLSPGLWKLTLLGESGLSGVSLGLLRVAGEKARSAMTVYTYRNRACFRQGDPVDLYVTVRGAEGVSLPDRIELVLARDEAEWAIEVDAPDAAAPLSTCHIRLDTSLLAPGDYMASARSPSIPCYAARFRMHQREPDSDFECYSHAPFCETRPEAGDSLTAYYAQGVGEGELGLGPWAAAVCGNMDAAFGMYGSDPAGPAVEKCAPPGEEEAALMALGLMGKRAVPSMPSMLHHEEWNPKHSLPEELQRMRRRVALFTQKYADLAGFGGVRLNWFATLSGYWEESPAIDGHQGQRNAAANEWVNRKVSERVEAEKKKNADPEHLKIVQQQAGYECWSQVLPAAYEQYLADARVIRPDATFHSSIPSFWLGNSGSYPPLAFSTLTHRDAVDYTDYGRSPWANFRAPAFLQMDNPARQRVQAAYHCYGRHARFIQAFGSAGRGIDGFALYSDQWGPFKPASALDVDHAELLRIFQRFGSYFTSLDPLPDVAVYFSKSSPWAHQKSVILHDLARLRRPGMLLAQEDVLRGDLKKYKILFLASIGAAEPKAVQQAFDEFQKAGGVTLKDRTCAEWVPGADIGFGYDGNQVHGGWGLGGPDGSWEFAHLWDNYCKTRETFLLKAFEKIPPASVSSSDREVLISPLAGKESICCFVINETYVPYTGGWWMGQHIALPRKADLIVEDGWFVRDLLEGNACELEKRNGANCVSMDFSRAEGKIFLLTRRPLQALALQTQRVATPRPALRVTAWLSDGGGRPLEDPLPFEVTLADPSGKTLFHKYASLGPETSLEIPLPAMRTGASLELSVRDLAAGFSASQRVAPASMPANPAVEEPDIIGLPQIRDFLQGRKKRAIVLLDEAQEKYRAAAGRCLKLLQDRGRDARLMTLDPAEVRELPLRWVWQEEDKRLLEQVASGNAMASRVNLHPWHHGKAIDFSRPTVGFAEYGPRLWIDGDVILFGELKDNRALADLEEFLRRKPSASYPSPGRFFLLYVWDAFLGESDALYIGCKDAAGAEAAVEYLSKVGAAPEKPAAAPADTVATQPEMAYGREPGPLENMIVGKFGAEIIDVKYSSGGQRIFLTLDSYGESFFVLDPAGQVLQKRPVSSRFGRNVWNRAGGSLRPISEHEVYMDIWGTEYLYNVEMGFVSKTSPPGTGLPGRHQIQIHGPVLRQDLERGRTYLGGRQKLQALDPTGRLLWAYDDIPAHTGTDALLYRRSLFVRGISPSGTRLLASAFGIETDVYSLGTVRNQSVLCIDTDTGKVLWEHWGLLLNAGKAIMTDERVILVDDDGRFHIFNIDTGEVAGHLRPAGGTDVILPIPRTDYLAIVENNAFNGEGATARAYLRAPGEAPDVVLDAQGRIKDLALSPDGRSIILSTLRGETACFGADGKARWRTRVPTGGKISISPDGQTVLVGSGEGTLYFLETATGKCVRSIDFNAFNLSSPKQYMDQGGSIGEVPVARAAQAPPEPPEASYLNSLDKDALSFGENLLPQALLEKQLSKGQLPEGDPAHPQSLFVLDRPVEFRLKVQPQTTYLVEFLNAAWDAGKLTGQTRIEIAIQGEKQSPHLPFSGRLPIGVRLARRRMAFRTGSDRQVTFSLRVVVPGAQGYQNGESSPTPMLVGELVVAALQFHSRSFLKEEVQGLPGSQGQPARGSVKCEVQEWSGGENLKHWWPYEAPQLSLRVGDGLIGNQDSSWHEAKGCPSGMKVAYANAWISFKKPEKIMAIAVYEDNQGPSPSGAGVVEWTSPHYALYIHEAKTDVTRRVGYVVENTNLVNIFTFPAVEVDKAQYFWAGRDYVSMNGGVVRMAEIEAYGTEEGEMDLEKPATEEGKEEEDLEIDMKD